MTMEASPINSVRFRGGEKRNGTLNIAIEGRLDSDSTGKIWREATKVVRDAQAPNVKLDAASIDYCDGSGIALLIYLRQQQQNAGGTLDIDGLRPEFRELLDDWSQGGNETAPAEADPSTRIVEEVGHAAIEVWQDIRALVSFVGELGVALVAAARHPASIRWHDTVRVAEEVGVNALPIVAMLSFLVGIITAFQAAVPLRQFGAQIFVANLIGLSISTKTRDGFSQRAKGYVQKLQVLTKRTLTIAFGDVAMNGIGSGNGLRTNPPKFKLK